jgi:hypothetical protein
MHVTVDLGADPPGVALVEPEDCRRFDVLVHGGRDAGALYRALGGAAVGRTEGDDVLVTVEAVRRLASGTVGPTWDADFDAMLDFARGRGWVTADGEAIRAHVEWR